MNQEWIAEVIETLPMELKFAPNDGVLLSESPTSRVYRIALQASTIGLHSYIFKVSTRKDGLVREKAVLDQVTSVLELPVPRIIAGAEGRNCSWVAYEDQYLQPLEPSDSRLQTSLSIVADLHQASPERALDARFMSHTPSVSLIFQQVLAEPIDSFASWIEPYCQVTGSWRRISRFIGKYAIDRDAWVQQPKVICHGDLHSGNIMWSSSEKKVYLIDWEFLHLDYGYFDLFQLLDATSPFNALCAPSRLATLATYYACNEGLQMQQSAADFIIGYLRFAMIHLLWIMIRISEDRIHQLHDAEMLSRQQQETVWALEDISSLLD